MTVIDYEERCADLGISVDDFFSSERKIIENVNFRDGESAFETYKDFLTHDELVATIRLNNLHKRYPNLFTWDGAVE